MVDGVNSVRTQINSSNISGSSSKPVNVIADTVSSSISVKKDISLHSTSSIRVDNLQNVAILEFRSADTGEVVAQFPTQRQIEAFRAAQSISEKIAEQAVNRVETSLDIIPVSNTSKVSSTTIAVSISSNSPAPALNPAPKAPILSAPARASAVASYVATSPSTVTVGGGSSSAVISSTSSIVV